MPPPPVSRLEKQGIPLYVQLAGILRNQLASGDYKPGDSLPTEEQVAKDFGVSLITVREARRVLAEEGLILRHAGKGTFVAEPHAPVTSLAAPTLEALIYGGQEHETRRECLVRKVLMPNPNTAKLLAIPSRIQAVEFQIRLYAHGRPFAHIVSTVPLHLGRRVSARRVEQKPLVFLLTELCGVRVGEVDQWTSVSEADPRAATALDLPAGTPVLTIQRIFFDTDGQPVQVSVNTFRGDRFRHHVRLSWSAPGATPPRHLVVAASPTVTRRRPHAVHGGHKP